jgi:hypothetical protein
VRVGGELFEFPACSRTSRIALAFVLASCLLPGIVPSSFPQKEVRASANVHSYAVAHGYCPASTSSGVSPQNTVGGNCGDSYLYMSNARAGYARFHYGFYSTDGTVYYRDLVVSWTNWTHLNYGNYTDATYMWNAGYDTTKTLYTKTGYVSGVLSGEVYLWWGGICSILHPTSSTTVTF